VIDRAQQAHALLKAKRHQLRRCLEQELTDLLHAKDQKLVVVKLWHCLHVLSDCLRNLSEIYG